jgi:hypothetical protein
MVSESVVYCEFLALAGHPTSIRPSAQDDSLTIGERPFWRGVEHARG